MAHINVTLQEEEEEEEPTAAWKRHQLITFTI